MTRVVVAFHSGYGHTRRVAESVHAGAASVAGVQSSLLDVSSMTDAHWSELDAADAIIFGSPTYMGGPSAPFKAFADAASKVWFSQGWKDKVAGGFTCSLNMSGDKYATLMYFVTFAMQQSMIWVGTGMMPPKQPGHPDEMNRLGSSIGVMAQADNVPPEQSPPKGDLDTARAYGERVAQHTRRLRG